MNNLHSRLSKADKLVKEKKVGEAFCDCGNDDTRRTLFEKLMRPLPGSSEEYEYEYVKPPCSLVAIGETCNPKPDGLTMWDKGYKPPTPDEIKAKKGLHDSIRVKLLGDDWEDREIVPNIAVEGGPGAIKEYQAMDDMGRAMEEIEEIKKPAPQESDDPIRDAVAARLIRPILTREELQNKLLVAPDKPLDD